MDKFRVVIHLIRGRNFTVEIADKIEVANGLVIVYSGRFVSVFPIQNIKYYNFEIIPNGR